MKVYLSEYSSLNVCVEKPILKIQTTNDEYFFGWWGYLGAITVPFFLLVIPINDLRFYIM